MRAKTASDVRVDDNRGLAEKTQIESSESETATYKHELSIYLSLLFVRAIDRPTTVEDESIRCNGNWGHGVG